MNINKLKPHDYDLIRKTYHDSETANDAQEKLSDHYDVAKRTIRNWANRIGLNVMAENAIEPSKILIYDIETCRVSFKKFWTGKTYNSHKEMRGEPKIISISWKYLGEDEIYDVKWDKNHSDKDLLTEFLPHYNKANMLIGFNNDNFDNRFVQARFAKFNMHFNTYVRSFDIMKEAKRKFRLPSYSMKYMCEYFDVKQKLGNRGLPMWDDIEEGTPEVQKKALEEMITYNRGDIVSTEALYYRLTPHFGHQVHLGVSIGEEKWTCPDTGSKNVELYKTTWTKAGTVQRIFKSNETERLYKISNRQYMLFLEYQMKKNLAR